MSDAAARAWVDAWTRGWRGHDADAVARAYADDAVFRSHPFRDVQAPREYAAQAFADEESADVRFGDPIVDGDRGAVQYWAVIRDREGKEWTLAGTSVLRFASDGRVSYHLDYWTMDDGAREPPPGWG